MSATHVLDTGALVAADRGDDRVWVRIDEARIAGDTIVIPTVAIAQAWRSRTQARLARLLAHCRVHPLTELGGRLAGELCGRAGTSDIADAAVVVTAATVGAIVWTSDPDDLSVLVAHLPRGAGAVTLRRVP